MSPCISKLLWRFRLAPAILLLCACSPTLNWRDVRPEGSPLVALFPCKPSQSERQISLEGLDLSVRLTSCEAGERVFAVTHVHAPAGIPATAVLRALRLAADRNVGSATMTEATLSVPGMSPDPLSGRFHWVGRREDGDVLDIETAFFSADQEAYQASIVGRSSEPEASEMFFSGLSLAKR